MSSAGLVQNGTVMESNNKETTQTVLLLANNTIVTTFFHTACKKASLTRLSAVAPTW